MRLSRFLMFGLASIFGSGCGGSPSVEPDDEPADEAAVVGGKADRADDSVVALVSPNRADWVCSGSVVAPRAVLTAAHCIDGGNYDKAGWRFQVFFGEDKNHPKTTDTLVDVVDVRLPDLYRTTVLGTGVDPNAPVSANSGNADDDGTYDGDVAVVFLASDAPVKPLPWQRTPLAASVRGQPVRFIGYGLTKAVGATKGARRQAATTISKLAKGALEIPPGPSPCHGDSGGPLLLKVGGVETIVGVGRTAFETCVDGATYARTDAYADFLSAALARR